MKRYSLLLAPISWCLMLLMTLAVAGCAGAPPMPIMFSAKTF